MLGKVVLWAGVSVVCAILYRLGGKKGYNTKFRDLGIPLIATGYLLLLGIKVPWWAFVAHFGLLFGALTTYWDSVLGYDNFYLHGFMCGLAAFPLCWGGIAWWTIGIRCIVIAVFMGLWCKFWGWDDMEEWGRGASIVASLPILLL